MAAATDTTITIITAANGSFSARHTTLIPSPLAGEGPEAAHFSSGTRLCAVSPRRGRDLFQSLRPERCAAFSFALRRGREKQSGASRLAGLLPLPGNFDQCSLLLAVRAVLLGLSRSRFRPTDPIGRGAWRTLATVDD